MDVRRFDYSIDLGRDSIGEQYGPHREVSHSVRRDDGASSLLTVL